MSISEDFPDLKEYLSKYEDFIQVLVSINGNQPLPALLCTSDLWFDSEIPLSAETELHQIYDDDNKDNKYYYNTSILKLLTNKCTFQITLNLDKSTFIKHSWFNEIPKEYKGTVIY